MRGAGVLLRRGKAVLEHDRQRGLLHRNPGSPEIDQLDLTVVAQEDVVRADVPVDDSLPVQRSERITDDRADSDRAFPLQRGALDLRFQRVTAQIFHNDIGRSVFFKIFPHLHDIRDRMELHHILCLVQKARIALPKFFRPFSRIEDDLLAAGNAVGNAGWEIFLQCNRTRKLFVVGAVCNAKAADTDHRLDAVPPGDLPTRLQRVWHFLRLRIAAVWTRRGRIRNRPAAFFTGSHFCSL